MDFANGPCARDHHVRSIKTSTGEQEPWHRGGQISSNGVEKVLQGAQGVDPPAFSRVGIVAAGYVHCGDQDHERHDDARETCCPRWPLEVNPRSGGAEHQCRQKPPHASVSGIPDRDGGEDSGVEQANEGDEGFEREPDSDWLAIEFPPKEDCADTWNPQDDGVEEKNDASGMHAAPSTYGDRVSTGRGRNTSDNTDDRAGEQQQNAENLATRMFHTH